MHPGRFRYSCAVTSWHNHAKTFKSTGAQRAEKSRDGKSTANLRKSQLTPDWRFNRCDFVVTTLNSVESCWSLAEDCWSLHSLCPKTSQDAPQTRRIEETVCLSITNGSTSAAEMWSELLHSEHDKHALHHTWNFSGTSYHCKLAYPVAKICKNQPPIRTCNTSSYSLLELTPDNWSNWD